MNLQKALGLSLVVTGILHLTACKTHPQVGLCQAKSQIQPLTRTRPEGDILWSRLRKRFVIAHEKEPTHPKVQRTAIEYSQPAHKVQSLTHSAAPYLYYVLEQIESRHLPSELALIPMVESGFQARATSNRGAAGIWQIIPATAKQLGLKQDKFYDGRRDVVHSTKAALDFLEYLHKEFDQDWMLAIAAYNAGQGAVHRAIAKNKGLGLPYKVWDLQLPKQTRDYVAKILALAEIIRMPCAYDVELRDIDNKPYLASIPVGPSSPLAFMAKLADMPLNELKKFNGGFKSLHTHPGLKQQALLLPVDNANRLSTQLAFLKLRSKSRLAFMPKNETPLVNEVHHYVIKSGDSLERIASKHRTSVSILRLINDLNSDQIRVGRSLLIPTQLARAN